MKKIISILLSSLLLITNIGLSMNVHYCGGEAVEHSISIGATSLDCGMERMMNHTPVKESHQKAACENPTKKADRCCENSSHIIDVDDAVQLNYSVLSFDLHDISLDVVAFPPLFEVLYSDADHFVTTHPTPFQSPPIVLNAISASVLYQSFLI